MAEPETRRWPVIAGHLFLIAVAVALWAAAVAKVEVGEIGDLGLLDALPPAYFVAVALLTAGFALLMGGGRERKYLAPLYVLVLILFLHATTPLIYDDPRYAWVYKHIGVVDLVARSGPPPRSLDIYANWPGFFGFGAWFQSVSGVRAIDYAPWSQVFFNLASVAALVFLYRGVTRHAGVIWCSVWIFVLGNWIGQDIFAPQAFAFVALVAFAGLVLRCAPSPRAPANWLERLIARIPAFRDGGTERSEPPPLGGALAAGVSVVLVVATVISHQLTPVAMILFALGVALFARRLRLWMVGLIVLAEAIWVGLAIGYIADSYDVLNFSPFDRLGPQKDLGGDPVASQQVVAYGARAVVLVLILLAVFGAWRRYQAGKRDVELWVLMIAPAVVLPLQSYGGEAPLRVFLFALPAIAFMVASLLVRRGPERSRVLMVGGVAATSCVVGALTLFAYFGLERINHISSDDVAVEQWIERCAPDGSVVTYLAPMAPSRSSAGYARLKLETSPTRPNIIEDGPPNRQRWGRTETRVLRDIARRYPGTANYVVVSPVQQAYLEFYGLVEPGSVQALKAGLAESNDFRLAFRDGDGYVYESAASSGERQPVEGCTRAA